MASEQQGDVVVGIDLGGTKALAGVVAADNSITGRAKISTRKKRDAEALLADVAACARSAVENAGIPFTSVRAVGIGVPGPVDPETGVVGTAPNLGWQDVPVRAILERELGVTVAVGNDVRVATLGEHQLGAGRGKSRVVTFFVGTGIGGGLVLDGKLYAGAHNAAGEIGHTFVAPGGPRCGAGHSGCLEAMASRTAIQRDIIAAVQQGKKSALTHIVAGNLANMKSSDLADALAQDDKVAKRVLKRAAEYLGYGIASAINLFDPDMIILGGGVVEALGDTFINWASKVARPNCICVAARDTPIVAAALGDDAGMLGAALLARGNGG
ncbi:MAG TPA: ROK family protein [Chloroflexota bacterium]